MVLKNKKINIIICQYVSPDIRKKLLFFIFEWYLLSLSNNQKWFLIEMLSTQNWVRIVTRLSYVYVVCLARIC